MQLRPSVKLRLDALCDQRGMTQIAVMTRLVDWFCDQEELVQASILGQLSRGTQTKLARQLLEQMAEDSSSKESEAIVE